MIFQVHPCDVHLSPACFEAWGFCRIRSKMRPCLKLQTHVPRPYVQLNLSKPKMLNRSSARCCSAACACRSLSFPLVPATCCCRCRRPPCSLPLFWPSSSRAVPPRFVLLRDPITSFFSAWMSGAWRSSPTACPCGVARSLLLT